VVRIDGHDKHISFPARRFQVSGMADVQHVEATISQHDAFLSIFVLSKLEGQGPQGQNFISRVHF
jgi:hypothetical protein